MDEKILKYLSDVITLAQFSSAAQMRLVNFKEMQPYFDKLDASLNAFWNLGVSETTDTFAISNYSQHLDNLVSMIMSKYGVDGNAFKTILDSGEIYLSAFYKSVVSRIALATYNVTLVAPSKDILVEFEKLVRNLPTVFKGFDQNSASTALKAYFDSGVVSGAALQSAASVATPEQVEVKGLSAKLNVQFNSGVCSLQLTPVQGSDLKASVDVTKAGTVKEVEAEIAKLVGDLVSGWVKLNSKTLSSEIDAYLVEKAKEQERINSFAQEIAKLTPEQAQALAQAVMQNANWNMIIKSKE